jgi:hypothetical protein
LVTNNIYSNGSVTTIVLSVLFYVWFDGKQQDSQLCEQSEVRKFDIVRKNSSSLTQYTKIWENIPNFLNFAKWS